ncbi:MAG: beta-propeller domain-containing protein [Lachnospiraceae bacterium]|nr:beta-propeller domain-containing protein [Lachnospiraceae bacterium]
MKKNIHIPLLIKIDDSETNEYKEPKTRVFLNDYDLNYENQSKNKLNKYERYVLKNGFPDYDADEIVKKIQIKDVRRSNVSKIYKFNLQKGNFVFVSDNTVEGWIENKLCMNEKDSYLMVFSTTSENTIKLNNFDYYYEGKRISGDSYVAYVYFDEEEHNSVTVFDEKMKQVSKIDGIAEGEKITQAKFIGNFGYMVTETNPLFTIDFSDNTKPVVGGALKMPGYLYDLLPFGDNLFLGFGSKDNQLKLDLYNIKDNIAKKNTNKVSGSEYYCYETGNSDATMVDGKNGYIGFCAGIVDEKLIYNLYQYNDGNFKQIKEIPIENIDAEKIRARIIGDYLYVIVLEDGIYSVNINLTDNDVMYTSF